MGEVGQRGQGRSLHCLFESSLLVGKAGLIQRSVCLQSKELCKCEGEEVQECALTASARRVLPHSHKSLITPLWEIKDQVSPPSPDSCPFSAIISLTQKLSLRAPGPSVMSWDPSSPLGPGTCGRNRIRASEPWWPPHLGWLPLSSFVPFSVLLF